MPDSDVYESSNINAIWLQNIYENIKNLEQLERIAREGCNSIMEYLQIPHESRAFILGDVQYKNLRFIITELDLLLIDLTPVIKESELIDFQLSLNKVKELIENRRLFLEEPRGVDRSIRYSKPKPFFYETLNFLSLLKVSIIKSIAHILYIKNDD